MIPQNSPEATEMLADLQKSCGLEHELEVTATGAMTSNEGYKAAYEKTMKGWQNKMPASQGTNRFEVENVADYDSARILDVRRSR